MGVEALAVTVAAGLLPAGQRPLVTAQTEFPPLPRVAREARTFVQDHLADVDDETLGVVVLLTSELVTNVVIHARTPMTVAIALSEGCVAVTVHDLDLGLSEIDLLQRDGGRGLTLVAGLADAHGVLVPPGGGKTAWFRVARAGGTA